MLTEGSEMSLQRALEGTWEEILTYSDELAGHRVRLEILSEEEEPYPGIPADQRPSTGGSLLKYAGTWVGDDLKERLEEVYRTRSRAKF